MSDYPHRPAKRSAPASSHKGSRKSKTWVSLGDVAQNGRDISPRLNLPWWKAPIFKAARLARLS